MKRLWLPIISIIFNWPLSKSTLTGLLSKSNSIAPWPELHFYCPFGRNHPLCQLLELFLLFRISTEKTIIHLVSKYICDWRWSYPIFKYFLSRLLSIILWVEYLLQGFSAEKIFNYILSQYQCLPYWTKIYCRGLQPFSWCLRLTDDSSCCFMRRAIT